MVRAYHGETIEIRAGAGDTYRVAWDASEFRQTFPNTRAGWNDARHLVAQIVQQFIGGYVWITTDDGATLATYTS